MKDGEARRGEARRDVKDGVLKGNGGLVGLILISLYLKPNEILHCMS